MKFSNLRLAGKLAVGFGAVLAIIAISSTAIYIQSCRLAEIERINSITSDAIDYLDRLAGDLEAARSNLRKYVLTGSPNDKAKADASLSKWTKNTAALKTILEKDGPQYVADLEAYRSATAVFIEKALDVLSVLAADPATRPQLDRKPSLS